jgi:DNA-binding NtrC family response regulator
LARRREIEAKSIAEGLLFGAKKGAYSGADAEQTGYFVAADRGVLFLDEIGTLDLELQAKVLRAIEYKVVHPLGATSPKRVDVGICCATNVDLEAAVEAGAFRRDLYARITQEVVHLPALRDRREEIPHLVHLALRQAEHPEVRPTSEFIEACLLQAWPTNVRGLFAAVTRAARRVVAARGRDLFAADLPGSTRSTSSAPEASRASSLPPPEPPSIVPTPHPTREEALPSPDDIKLERLKRAYLEHGGDVEAAARSIGMSRTTAYRWLKKLGFRSDRD